MIRHAVRATVAVAALSLAVLSSLVQAQDTPSAQELADLRARAEAGDTSAQFRIGVMYVEGRGVPEDAVEAAAWFRLAAEQGDASAQNNLGRMHAEGRGGAAGCCRSRRLVPAGRRAGPRQRAGLARAEVTTRVAVCRRMLPKPPPGTA